MGLGAALFTQFHHGRLLLEWRMCREEKEEVEVWPGEPVLESLESKNC